MINLARCNVVRQQMKFMLDDLHEAFPDNAILVEVHVGFSEMDTLFHLFAKTIGWQGPAPLDGEPQLPQLQSRAAANAMRLFEQGHQQEQP